MTLDQKKSLLGYNRLKSKGISLEWREGKIYATPSAKVTPEMVGWIRMHKDSLRKLIQGTPLRSTVYRYEVHGYKAPMTLISSQPLGVVTRALKGQFGQRFINVKER